MAPMFGRQDSMGGFPSTPSNWSPYNPQPPQGPYYPQQHLPPG